MPIPNDDDGKKGARTQQAKATINIAVNGSASNSFWD
jgi:hypothetical protein